MSKPVKNSKKIIICGPTVKDQLLNFKGQYKELINPKKIDKLSLSINIEDFQQSYGGVGANIAYSLAMLGENPVLVSSVGLDSKDYIQKLFDMGVDITGIHFSNLPTASYHVLSDIDNNQIGGLYLGAMIDNHNLSFKQWKDENSIFVISPDEPKLINRLIDECQENNLKMFFDFGQQVSNASIETLIKGVKTATVLISNEYEISTLCRRCDLKIEDILSFVPIVVVTHGSAGSTIYHHKKKIYIKPARVDKVVGPTGAGDAYRAGFLYGYARNMDLDICGKIGSIVAAYSVEKNGAQEHFFDTESFQKRFFDNYKFEINLKKIN